jgi:hypothetical protein
MIAPTTVAAASSLVQRLWVIRTRAASNNISRIMASPHFEMPPHPLDLARLLPARRQSSAPPAWLARTR